ncbi:nuclease-related domain-containing protein [Gryllotalpicola koreensis]|uniref:NERD domain-containing protein n=1 Tax=Gryllotalpicola koreensis TaxID=993086 RepID=A0ABP8A0R3_9MICO
MKALGGSNPPSSAKVLLDATDLAPHLWGESRTLLIRSVVAMGEAESEASGVRAQRVDFAGINALSSRAAGYAVALKCLHVQSQAEAADPSLKTATQVRLHPEAWPWYQGALGEIEVGKMLAELEPEWFVRHSVPIGADTKDVDHLVIGPGGVFAINTKHHAGASVWVGDHVLRVNNGNTPHLKVGRNDAADVARRLSGKVGFPVPVIPVIAVLNARSLTDRRSPRERPVEVVNASHLVAWLRAYPQQLSPAKIELIKLAAEEPETWHVDPHAADTYRVMQRFERLVARASVTPPRTAPARARGARRAPSAQTSHRTGSPSRARALRTTSKGRGRAREATIKNIAQLWLFGAVVLVLAIYGTGKAARCASAPIPTGTAGLNCTLAVSLAPYYPLAWWVAGGVLLLALVTTIFQARRSNT